MFQRDQPRLAHRWGRDPIASRIDGRDARLNKGGAQMEALEAYSSAVAVLSAALLLIAAGLAKKQLVWKRVKPLPARRRRRKS
jgi:hypothetical protein